MFNTIGVIPKLNAPDDDNVRYMIDTVKAVASDLGINAYVLGDINVKLQGNVLFLALGGDGTMLHAMKYAALHGEKGYAYGINLGNLGFLTEMSRLSHDKPQDMWNALARLFKGEHISVEKRVVIRLNDTLAVNEVSISQLYADAMITYNLSIDGQDAGLHKANSLLVSTPTGSTAYALSAGGSLMTPNIQALQIVPVAPIKLTARPIIVSSTAEIEVKVWGDGIAVRTDGQVWFKSEEKFTQDKPFLIELTAHSHPAKVLHFEGWNFFDVLSEKLGWMKK